MKKINGKKMIVEIKLPEKKKSKAEMKKEKLEDKVEMAAMKAYAKKSKVKRRE